MSEHVHQHEGHHHHHHDGDTTEPADPTAAVGAQEGDHCDSQDTQSAPCTDESCLS